MLGMHIGAVGCVRDQMRSRMVEWEVTQQSFLLLLLPTRPSFRLTPRVVHPPRISLKLWRCTVQPMSIVCTAPPCRAAVGHAGWEMMFTLNDKRNTTSLIGGLKGHCLTSSAFELPSSPCS
jgi:hypothetical protein